MGYGSKPGARSVPQYGGGPASGITKPGMGFQMPGERTAPPTMNPWQPSYNPPPPTMQQQPQFNPTPFNPGEFSSGGPEPKEIPTLNAPEFSAGGPSPIEPVQPQLATPIPTGGGSPIEQPYQTLPMQIPPVQTGGGSPLEINSGNRGGQTQPLQQNPQQLARALMQQQPRPQRMFR